MRDNRRSGRLALAVAAAMFAGLLTAWAEPSSHNLDTIEREIASVMQDVRSDALPALTTLDQAWPVARTMVSRSQ